MKAVKIITAVCLAALPVLAVYSQRAAPLRTDRDIQALCEETLANVVAGDVSRGIGALRPYATGISVEDVDSLETQIRGQAATITKNYGDPLGFMFISGENLRDTVIRLVYIVKYQKHMIRWSFIFYKPVDSWILDYVNYDDSVEALFGPKSPPPTGK
ncbi:MAG TPA: hypothetical protein VMV03_03465 [Spirochaetia bacterium]|nr:hypothetical protein [Spirochaetia bacterium]